MSQENVEIVLRAIQALEDDEKAMLSTLDPAVEWYPIEDETSRRGALRRPPVSASVGSRSGRVIRSIWKR